MHGQLQVRGRAGCGPCTCVLCVELQAKKNVLQNAVMRLEHGGDPNELLQVRARISPGHPSLRSPCLPANWQAIAPCRTPALGLVHSFWHACATLWDEVCVLFFMATTEDLMCFPLPDRVLQGILQKCE